MIFPQVASTPGTIEGVVERINDQDRRLRRLEGDRSGGAGSNATFSPGAGSIPGSAIAADGTLNVAALATGTITSAYIGVGAVEAGHIAANSIESIHIAANAVTATEIAAGSITASHIQTGTVIAATIEAGSISADLVNFDIVFADEVISSMGTFGTLTATYGLSAITANLGDITAGKITGGQFLTAGTGARVVMGTNLDLSDGFGATFTGLAGVKADGTVTFKINSSGEAYFKGVVQSGATGLGNFSDTLNPTTQLVDNTVDGGKIVTGTLAASKIVAGSITSLQIDATSIRTAVLTADAINAVHINTGALDGEIITGATIRSAASGARVQMTSAGLTGYDTDGTTQTFTLTGSALTVTKGTITGATLQTASSGARVVISGTEGGLEYFNASNVRTMRLSTSAGGMRFLPDDGENTSANFIVAAERAVRWSETDGTIRAAIGTGVSGGGGVLRLQSFGGHSWLEARDSAGNRKAYVFVHAGTSPRGSVSVSCLDIDGNISGPTLYNGDNKCMINANFMTSGYMDHTSAGSSSQARIEEAYGHKSWNYNTTVHCFNAKGVIAGTSSGGAAVGTGGLWYTTFFGAWSDEAAKASIRDADPGVLAKLRMLRPRKFYKRDYVQNAPQPDERIEGGRSTDMHEEHGFIAQEVAQVFPELVQTWEPSPGFPNGTAWIEAGSQFNARMVQAIQELADEVDELRSVLRSHGIRYA